MSLAVWLKLRARGCAQLLSARAMRATDDNNPRSESPASPNSSPSIQALQYQGRFTLDECWYTKEHSRNSYMCYTCILYNIVPSTSRDPYYSCHASLPRRSVPFPVAACRRLRRVASRRLVPRSPPAYGLRPGEAASRRGHLCCGRRGSRRTRRGCRGSRAAADHAAASRPKRDSHFSIRVWPGWPHRWRR